MNQTEAVILAAGKSSRMGQPKALLPLGSGTFLTNLIQTFLTAVERVVIVTSPQLYGLIANNLQKQAVELVINPFPELGRFYSVLLGLNACSGQLCFLHNVDVPCVKSETLRKMLLAYRSGTVLVPQYQGKGGHPILFDRTIKSRILRAKVNSNLRQVLQTEHIVKLPVIDPFVVQNINRPEDFKELLDAVTKKL